MWLGWLLYLWWCMIAINAWGGGKGCGKICDHKIKSRVDQGAYQSECIQKNQRKLGIGWKNLDPNWPLSKFPPKRMVLILELHVIKFLKTMVIPSSNITPWLLSIWIDIHSLNNFDAMFFNSIRNVYTLGEDISKLLIICKCMFQLGWLYFGFCN